MFGDGGEGSSASVEGGEEGRGFVSIESDLHVLLVVHILNAEDGGGVIEGTDAELEVVDIGGGVPLVAPV